MPQLLDLARPQQLQSSQKSPFGFLQKLGSPM